MLAWDQQGKDADIQFRQFGLQHNTPFFFNHYTYIHTF